MFRKLFGILFLSLCHIAFGSYIVILKKDAIVPNELEETSFKIGDFKGILVDEEYKAQELENLGIVESIEPNTEIKIDDPVDIEVVYQWGLDRIDQKDLPLDKKKFNPYTNGEGTYVYVCDTGVRLSHNEFNGRVEYGYSHYGSGNDIHGHGTHVMSTVIGKNVGVASKAKGISVKVLSDSGSGSIFGVIKGVEWAVKDMIKKKRCGVISMSLGGGKSTTLNNAVDAAVNAGFNVIVAAGNSRNNACDYSPAGASKVITVGSTTSQDSLSWFSNQGTCTNILAPGSYIIGASNKDNKSYRTLSGTSMACPHVSGASLLILSSNNCNQKRLLSELVKFGVKDKIKNVNSNTPNLLLNTEEIAFSVKPTNNPTLRPTRTCYNECRYGDTYP